MTELDLRESLIPMSLIEHLTNVMPRSSTGDGYDYHSFLHGLVSSGISPVNGSSSTSGEMKVSVVGGMARSRSKHYL